MSDHDHAHADAPGIEAADGRVHAHISSWQFYAFILGILMALTLLTVGVSYIHLGKLNLMVAVAIATVKASLPFLAADRSVAETLREANRRVAERLEPREFVALAYLKYEPATGAFALGNAGLPAFTQAVIQYDPTSVDASDNCLINDAAAKL